MSEKLKVTGKWLMVVSLCTALGLQWVALQSVAWVGMLVSYSRSGSITTAIAHTFDGRHPCPLCQAIARSQQSGKKQDVQVASGKIDMDYRRQPVLLFPPRQGQSWPALASTACSFCPEPVHPPPRAAC